jgi:hypothetical protein
MKPQEQWPEGTTNARESKASEGAVTEGFFFAQQTHRGEERKIRTAQAVAMPQGAARWTTRAGGGPAGGLAKDTEQCRMVGLSASGSSSSIQDG